MHNKVLFINNIGATFLIPGLLVKNGYEVDMVSDSETGLRQLGEHTYNLVIVLENPAVPSWRLCAKIRGVTGIPFIVISANASTETCVKAINAGADYFMRKPFSPLELLARINSLFQRAQPRQIVPVFS
jgi:two-component system OmpR family response regulator